VRVSITCPRVRRHPHSNPRGTDLSLHSQAKLSAIARQLNERPRKTLLYQLSANLIYSSMTMFLQEPINDAPIVGLAAGGQVSVRRRTVVAVGESGELLGAAAARREDLAGSSAKQAA
jgi:hypothetical protein